MLPAGHPARALFEAARSTASTPAPDPAAGRLLFDGGELTDLYDRNRTASTTSAVLLGAAGAVGVGAVFAW
jgi:hypothetical protein